MILTARPSKTFLFNILQTRLKQITSGNGLDAASAGFKNRKMFRTDTYYGLDIDLLAIKNGLNKYNDNKTFGILGDLNDLNKIPAEFFSAIVSTNTLDHLKNKNNAISQLVRLLSPGGTLICHLALDKEFDGILEFINRNFSRVEVRYIKNPLSMTYENFFERNGDLGYHPVASSKPFLLMSWILSRLEYLTSYFRTMNDQVILIAKTKKDNKNKDQTNTINLPKISERLYDANN